jgi:hypothetical protein
MGAAYQRLLSSGVRKHLVSSGGTSAANEVFPDAAGEKPLVGGGTSVTLLMEFFSSPSDFSACCSLAHIRSQSCHCQHLPVYPRRHRAHLSRQSHGAAVDMNQAIRKVMSVLP